MAKGKTTGRKPAPSKPSGKPAGEAVIEGKADEPRKKKSVSPLQFLQQVRAEVAKVTWTSRNETLVSTIMVLIMVAIMAIFFFAVDTALRAAVCTALPIDCVSRDL